MIQQKVTILGIAPYRFLPVINGGHKAIEQLYRNLGELTKTVVISTKNNTENLPVNYVLIRLFTNSILRYINLFYFFKLKRVIHQYKITHVITEQPYMGWLGILLKKYTGVKFVVRSHNIEATRFKTINKWWWKGMWHYEKWVYRKADIVCFIIEEDRDYAARQYHLTEEKSIVATFGTELNKAPDFAIKQSAKAALQQRYQIPSSHKIILFNGSFSYQPNLDALYHLLNSINPLLINQETDNYTILICGIDIPQSVLYQKFNNVVIAGFVNNVNEYFMAADIFICPVTSGGGIKTKLIEALANDNTCVSYRSSAIGIDKTDCNNKLLVAEDNNAEQFVNLIQQALKLDVHINDKFYQRYGVKSIVQHLLNTLQHTIPQ